MGTFRWFDQEAEGERSGIVLPQGYGGGMDGGMGVVWEVTKPAALQDQQAGQQI